MIERCPYCNGKKTLIGLGNIIVKCKSCSGVGYIESKEPEEESKEELPKKNGKPAFKRND